MGPLVLPKNSANNCGWAHWCCQRILLMVADGPTFLLIEILPMVSYGPSVVPETCCQKLQIGPLVLLRNSTDGCGWANCFSHRNTAGDVIWAQCCFRDMLPKAVNGPIGVAETCCRLPQMDQSFLQRNAANGVIWAHCWSLIILNVPIIAAR